MRNGRSSVPKSGFGDSLLRVRGLTTQADALHAARLEGKLMDLLCATECGS